MIPRHISATNYGPYEHLDWEIPEGLSAIVGHNLLGEGIDSNGAGKTMLLELIPLCLFGPSLPWSEKISIGSAEACQVELEFLHAGNIYRIRRVFDPRGRGKTTLDFERVEDAQASGNWSDEDAWEPLTRENQAETQKLIESVIGLSETTFSHSVFAFQGGYHFADPSLQPRERKEILAEALDLAVWDRYLELARADKTTLEKQQEGLRAQAQALEAESGRRDELALKRQELSASLGVHRAAREAAEEAVQNATEAYTTLQESQRAIEQVRARKAESDALIARTEQERNRWTTQAQAGNDAAERLAQQATAHKVKVDEIASKLSELERTAAPLCDRCGQPVADQSLENMRKGLEQEQQAHQLENVRLLGEAAKATTEAAENMRAASALADPEPFIVTPEEKALIDSTPSDEQVQAAKTAGAEAVRARDVAERALNSAEVELARVEEALVSLDGLAQKAQAAAKEATALNDRIDELRALETAYGRNGIPALILEAQAIPQLELEAQRILEQLGLDYRIELQTQRETKSGTLKDTLDVLVYEPRGVRRYETYSGGERTRLEFALRIALARLVAQRSASEISVLALDEMVYLDAAGMAAVAQVLRGLTEFRTILVISHDERLVDSFDQQVTVVRDEHGSRLEEALVA